MNDHAYADLSRLVGQVLQRNDLEGFAAAFCDHLRRATGACATAVLVDEVRESPVFAMSADRPAGHHGAAAMRARMDCDASVRTIDAGLARVRLLVDGAGPDVQCDAVDEAVQVLRVAIELAAARDEAAHDPLTGLANRRQLAERLGGAIEEGNRYETTFAFAMIDMNNFKWFNDTYGHAEGDALLRAMARVLRSRVRKSDVAARYGGDEFVLLLPHTAPDDASTMLERIAVELEQFLRRYDTKGVCLGFSYGLAHYPDDGRDWETLVRRADERLYNAKQQAALDRR